ncbi:uncharacterized protein LOC116030364 [Ipomoea triloba]|uniref:uncharacterized protein LOC116030364 n=1 Tax=Ipomoea triloba TaxID=35885 RepID=UPI00125D0D0F|nr:uncharacterized protein LOC116030364 [Ipomoea triloba]
MGESDPPITHTALPHPPETAHLAPPPPPAPPSAPPLSQPPKTKKRPLDVAHLQSTPYFKMRAIVKELRPHVIEVLRSPDFRNCKAATEIRQQLNLLMDLYKETTAEAPPLPKKLKNAAEGHNLLGDTQDGQKPVEKPPPERQSAKPSEDKPVLSENLSPSQQTVDDLDQGTYIVGGSAFGWNFVTYPGTKPIYYGRTKECFRSANPLSQ